ncbi:hypothetical protein CFB82_34160 [Burkholderia sp. HI2714]|nr:hypothetical protein CFB82_34160 [Burkholderia sp. HI2714]
MGEEVLILCTHPDYLAANPTIRAVDDLRNHRLIAFRMPTTGRDRPLAFVEHGRTVALTIEARFHINHGEALAEAAALVPRVSRQSPPAPRHARGSVVDLSPRAATRQSRDAGLAHEARAHTCADRRIDQRRMIGAIRHVPLFF